MSTRWLPRRLLLPLTPLYRLALAAREWKLRRGLEPVRRLPFPVISIGNLSTGGAGKTPFAIALAQALSARGFAVDILSRGYGRRPAAPARVRLDGTPEEFGDEPLLIAREAGVPVYVGRERYEAGVLAERSQDLPSGAKAPEHSAGGYVRAEARTLHRREGPGYENRKGPGYENREGPGYQNREGGGDQSGEGREYSSGEGSGYKGTRTGVHILDDAFQHRQLHRDVDILLLNREDWRDRLLPAGNLREPLCAAKRADVIAIPADDSGLERELRAWGWNGPLWRLRRRMQIPPLTGPVVAFCGIARPGQFFSGLEAAGLRLAARAAFRDHHRYTQRDVERLQTAAKTGGASALVTTSKDEVRLRAFGAGSGLKLPILTAQLTIEIQDESAALDWLIARVSGVVPPIVSL